VLRAVAEWNPISALVQAVRELWGNTGPAPADSHLPMHHPVLFTILWTVGITAVVAPLALRTFRNRTMQ
jgi:ABC-type polysaccharide/polyol phosphate export permease